MRKHFLILMLMALLPLAGWAEITLTGAGELYDGNAYDAGSHQVIKTAPTYTGAGTLSYQYALTTTNDAPAASEFTTDDITNAAVKAKNAGTYYAWVKVTSTDEGEGPVIARVTNNTFTITKINITVAAKNPTMTYGDNYATALDVADFYSITNASSPFVGGESVATVGHPVAKPTFDNFSAGPKPFTLQASELQNYSVSLVSPSGVLTIAQKAIQETWFALAEGDLTYTGSEQTKGVITTAAAPEGLTYTVAGNKQTNATEGGTPYTITITGSGNYGSTVEKTFDILKASIVKNDIAVPVAKTLTYNADNQQLITAGSVPGGSLKYKVDGGEWKTDVAEVTGKNATSYTVTYEVVPDANHKYVAGTSEGPLTVSASIDKKVVVVQPNPITAYYGKALATTDITYAFDGIENADLEAGEPKAGVITGTIVKDFTVTKDADDNYPVGNYEEGTTLSGFESANYDVIPVNGVLTVNKAKVKIVLQANKTAATGSPEAALTSWDVLTTDIKVYTQNGDATYADTEVSDADDLAKIINFNATSKVVTGLTLTRATEKTGGKYLFTLASSAATFTASYQKGIDDANSKGLVVEDVAVNVTVSNKAKVYGGTNPALTYTVTSATSTALTTAQVNAIKAVLDPLIAREDAVNENVGNYAINFGDADAATEGIQGPVIAGYDITYKYGTFVITKKPLTITINDLSMNKGDTKAKLNAYASCQPYTTVNSETIAFEYRFTNVVSADDGATVTVNAAANAYANAIDGHLFTSGEDGYDANNNNYNVTFVKGALKVLGANDLFLNEADENLGAKIVAAADACAADATGETKFSVSLSSRELKKETWAAMVLPFETSVTEISGKLGYAVVDILDQSKSGSDVYLKLHMGNIPANTPFIVKYYRDDVLYTAADAITHNAGLTGALNHTTPLTNETAAAYNRAMNPETDKVSGETLSEQEAIDYNATLDGAVGVNDIKINYATYDLKHVTFDSKYIVYDNALKGSEYADAGYKGYNVYVDDAAGNLFVGTYESTPIWGSNYKAITGSGKIADAGSLDEESAKLYPVEALRAYFKLVTPAARILIEEPDGTTTVIEGITVEKMAAKPEGWYTLNGVKLNGVPTEKGIYINNGKKVVIK